jgi:protein subunit release factor A
MVMKETELQIKLNNARLYNELKRMKKISQEYSEEKSKVKNLVIEYKNALNLKNEENSKLKKENEELKQKYNQIPEFVRNFFQE